MDYVAKVTSKGQVTIPVEVREALALRTGDSLLLRLHDGRAVVSKVPDFLELAGSVPVPPGKTGRDWTEVRAEAWRLAAEDRAAGWDTGSARGREA